MTDIASPTASAPTPRSGRSEPSAAAAPAPEPSAGAVISSDFDTFLKMLTAQVQNQDPLNPLDSTDFAVQLATFSGVEQQVQTNELLGSLAASLGGGDLTELAGWVGMEGQSTAPVRFDGAPITLQTSPQPGAARAELRVSDPAGTVWDRVAVPPEAGTTSWSGRRDDGTAFPAGTYRFEVVSFDAEGGIVSTTAAAAYQAIREARLGSDGPELVLASGDAVPPADVTALRRPAGEAT